MRSIPLLTAMALTALTLLFTACKTKERPNLTDADRLSAKLWEITASDVQAADSNHLESIQGAVNSDVGKIIFLNGDNSYTLSKDSVVNETGTWALDKPGQFTLTAKGTNAKTVVKYDLSQYDAGIARFTILLPDSDQPWTIFTLKARERQAS